MRWQIRESAKECHVRGSGINESDHGSTLPNVPLGTDRSGSGPCNRKGKKSSDLALVLAGRPFLELIVVNSTASGR